VFKEKRVKSFGGKKIRNTDQRKAFQNINFFSHIRKLLSSFFSQTKNFEIIKFV